jgi:hypothetical protein
VYAGSRNADSRSAIGICFWRGARSHLQDRPSLAVDCPPEIGGGRTTSAVHERPSVPSRAEETTWSNRGCGNIRWGLLDIADEVNALADVIAASERHPPLAVGLFGDWGSGKSFFIGRLKQRLDVLTHTARSARAENRPTTYAGRVVHVDFNAWQYADGNLWANLVHRIFDKLARKLTGNAKDQESEQLEEQRKQLYGRLALSREQLVENEWEKTAAAQASEAARVAQAVLAEQRNRAASNPAVGRLGDALAKLGARAAGKDGSEALARDFSDGEALAWRTFSKKIEAVAQELELPVTADAFRDRCVASRAL